MKDANHTISSFESPGKPPGTEAWLAYIVFAIPALFLAMCIAGWFAAGPWDPRVALAPYAPILWLIFASAVGVVLVVELVVAVSRILPGKRYRQYDGRGNFGEPKDVFVKRQHLLRILKNDANALFEGTIQVRHVMTRSPVTTTPKESLEAACELMKSKNVNHLAVCNDDGLLVGMLSRHYARRSNARTVEKAMLGEPISVSPDALLNPTVTQMISAGVSCVAVVAEGYCVGILTTADVQLTLQCALTLMFKATNEDPGGSPDSAPPGAVENVRELDEVLASVGPGA